MEAVLRQSRNRHSIKRGMGDCPDRGVVSYKLNLSTTFNERLVADRNAQADKQRKQKIDNRAFLDNPQSENKNAPHGFVH